MALLDKYPIDLTELHKGQLLDLSMLEEITSKKRGTQEFDFAVLGIQERINDRTPMTAKVTTDGLRILTDSEASEYNQRQFSLALGRTVRRHGKALQVDVVNLPPEEQRMHERRLINQSRVVQAIARARAPRKIEGQRIAEQSGGMESIGEDK